MVGSETLHMRAVICEFLRESFECGATRRHELLLIFNMYVAVWVLTVVILGEYPRCSQKIKERRLRPFMFLSFFLVRPLAPFSSPSSESPSLTLTLTLALVLALTRTLKMVGKALASTCMGGAGEEGED